MTREEAIKNLNMISISFVDPVTREQRKLINDTFEMAISALEQNESAEEWYKLFVEKLNEQEPCEDAISLDAVIEWLKEKDFIKMSWQEENARKELQEYFSVTPSRRKGHWIDIDKQKPEVGISVLVCDDEDDIYLTHITREGRFFDEYGNYIKGIVAWMPLPKPYEPQESEDKE